MKRQIAIRLRMEDPQDLAPLEQAYCVLVEVHMNFEQGAITAVFKCWRNEQAFLAQRKAFDAIQIPFTPEEGGKEFFQNWNETEGSLQLNDHLKRHCLKHPLLAQAKICE